MLLGDAHRDQGQLKGPRSAAHSYRRALSVYDDLDIPRRVTQVELSLTVVAEMGGELRQISARQGETQIALFATRCRPRPAIPVPYGCYPLASRANHAAADRL